MGLKAMVKATGEIFDIEGVSLRLTGKVLSTFGLDEVEVLMPDLTTDYWTRLEHQYAGMAMQGMLSNPEVNLDYKSDGCMPQSVAAVAYIIAHALVEKYKKEEK